MIVTVLENDCAVLAQNGGVNNWLEKIVLLFIYLFNLLKTQTGVKTVGSTSRRQLNG